MTSEDPDQRDAEWRFLLDWRVYAVVCVDGVFDDREGGGKLGFFWFLLLTQHLPRFHKCDDFSQRFLVANREDAGIFNVSIKYLLALGKNVMTLNLRGREGTISSDIIQEAGHRLPTSFPARHGSACCDLALKTAYWYSSCRAAVKGKHDSLDLPIRVTVVEVMSEVQSSSPCWPTIPQNS